MRESDSQGPHKLEHSQAKSKPLLCLALPAKAELNKEDDSGGGKLERQASHPHSLEFTPE